ncbi:MAG: hypothetical protein AB7K09_08570 [Planctomycetota bacterium]
MWSVVPLSGIFMVIGTIMLNLSALLSLGVLSSVQPRNPTISPRVTQAVWWLLAICIVCGGVVLVNLLVLPAVFPSARAASGGALVGIAYRLCVVAGLSAAVAARHAVTRPGRRPEAPEYFATAAWASGTGPPPPLPPDPAGQAPRRDSMPFVSGLAVGLAVIPFIGVLLARATLPLPL